MCNPLNEQTAESFFGKVISTYTRAQAIEDGVLIDPGPMAKEAGFKWPVALTVNAWADCVVWNDDDSEQQVHQDQSGRLWDVLYMASHAIRTSKDSGDRLMFQLYRVPHDGYSTEAVLVTLKMIVGPGDSREPVITILLLPNED
jgi:hypothetical protein